MTQQEYLSQCFKYDAETGLLFWRARPIEHFKNERGFKCFNAQKTGKPAGCISEHGGGKYYKVRLNKTKLYFSHRVIWEMHHGEIPQGMDIDHKDGNGLNNRLDNIRIVTKSGNMKNRRIGVHNKSGYHGINWVPRLSKWVAQITSDGVTTNVGTFSNFSDAFDARKDAEVKLGFFENHGRK